MPERYDNMSERLYTEKPLLEQLSSFGWSIIDLDVTTRNSPELSNRESLADVIMREEFHNAISRLNPWLKEEQVEPLIDEFLNYGIQADALEINRKIQKHLVDGLTADNLYTGAVNESVRLFDYTNLEKERFDITKSKNSYIAVCQLKVKIPGVEQHIIPDVVLFVNGIPLVVIECKAPDIVDPMGQAIEQLMRYQDRRDAQFAEGVPELFYFNQFVIATSFQQAKYTTITGAYNHFIEWKDCYPYALLEIKEDGTTPSGQEVLVKGMLSPNHLLDIMQNFTVFKDDEKGRTAKIVCRYQQFRGVHKIINRMRSGETQADKGGTVWHTQGSGKSLTMMFVIKKMNHLDDFIDYKIVLILDRKDLQKQLLDTSNCISQTVTVGKSIATLKPLIKDPASNIVVAMVHKFGVKKASMEIFPVLNTSKKILIMIDEAHRTQYSHLAANMWQSMPNSIKVAFTGTPIDRTTETFGGYIDAYTMRQAIADEVIVEIKYEGRATESNIKDISAMDDKFLDVFAFANESQKKQILGKYTLRGYLEAWEVIEKKAKDMLEHYISTVFTNGFKAQVVTCSQEAAYRYKVVLDRLLQAKIAELETLNPNNHDLEVLKRMQIACIISAQGNDKPYLKEFGNEHTHDKQIASFKLGYYAEDTDKKGNKITGEVGIIVVADMLLTGFDAPIEQVMYLDDIIRDHNLLQAIARVNRTSKGKECGYVVDYIGVFNHLKKALAKYKDEDIKETTGALLSVGQDYDKLRITHDNLTRFVVEEIGASGLAEKTFICDELAEDDKLWQNFNKFFNTFAKYLDRVYPKPSALPYVPDFKVASFIKQCVANRRRDGNFSVAECGRKIRSIIEEYLIVNGVNPKIRPVSITNPIFDTTLKEKSPRAQAEELKYAIQEYININTPLDPEYFERLGVKLQKILELYKENWEAQVQALKEYKDEIIHGRSTENTYGLDPVKEMPFFALVRAKLYEGKSFEDLTAEEFDTLRSMIDEILSTIQTETQIVNFWDDPYLIQNLRYAIRRKLLDSYKYLRSDRAKASAIAQELIELASRHYGEKQ